MYMWSILPVKCYLFISYLCSEINIFHFSFIDEDLIRWGWPEDVWLVYKYLTLHRI